MKTGTAGLFLVSILISACAPGQILGPTLTSTQTNTSTPTPTYTPTPTQTPTLTPTFTVTSTPTKISTSTPTPPPGLNVKTDTIVKNHKDFFTFRSIADIDGQPAQEGVTSEGFSTITLVGSPDLVQAELRIDLSQENPFFATGYWIYFLEVTTYGGKEAADWVHDHFSEAIENGKVENVFGEARVILESNSSGSLFIMTILPAMSQ